MPEDPRLAFADAVMSDVEPWVCCRALRDQQGTIRDFEYVLANAAAVARVGRGPLIGRRLLEVVSDVVESEFPDFCETVETGVAKRLMVRTPLTEVPAGWTPGWVALWLWAAGDALVVHWRDVTAAQTDALAAAREDARLQALLENAVEVTAVFSADGVCTYLSPSAERVLGRHDALGLITDAVHPDDRSLVEDLFARCVSSPAGAVAENEVRVQHGDGRWLWVHARATNHLDHPDVGGIVVNWWDVTEQRELAEQLRLQALHDPLTGLPNRRLVDVELSRALAGTKRDGNNVGVVMCDIDFFKRVNDTLGHLAGDQLLVAVADRLRSAVRPADTVGRLGGDEFVAVCPELHSSDELGPITARIRDMVRGEYDLANSRVPVTISVGATCGRHPDTLDELLTRADGALYAAKAAGRDRTSIHEPPSR